MNESQTPMTPVRPTGMEIIFLYPCPHCGREVPMMPPTQPSMARCDACRGTFPVVPVDGRGVQFMKLMTENGKAAVDPNFL